MTDYSQIRSSDYPERHPLEGLTELLYSQKETNETQINSFTEYSVGEGTAARQLTAMPGTIAVGSRLSGDILSSGVGRVR